MRKTEITFNCARFALALVGLALVVWLASFGQVTPVASQTAQHSIDTVRMLMPPNPAIGINRRAYGATAVGGYRHELAADAGSTWNRWPLYWHGVEDQQGRDYSEYDASVVGDLTRGVNLELVLLGTPFHRSSKAEDFRGSTPLNLSLPVFADGTDEPGQGKTINQDNYWASFVHETVHRYKPNGELYRLGRLPAGVGVRYWEIWNEPDVAFYWSGRGPGTEVGDYYRLLKVAALAARSADPEARIIIGGLSFWGSEHWIHQLFELIKADPEAAAQRDFFDVVAWHVYSRTVDMFNRSTWSRHQLADFGFANKEVWINETNIPVWGDPTPEEREPRTHRGTPEEQASFILQGHAYAYAGGADRILSFMLYDDCWQWGEHYGLVRNPPGQYPIDDCSSDGEPRPAYYAYKLAALYLNDIRSREIMSLGDGGGVEVVRFDTGNGARVSVVFNKFGYQQTVDIGVRSRAWLIDQSGATTVLEPDAQGRVMVTAPGATANDAAPHEEPVYIVGGRTSLLVEPAPGGEPSLLQNGVLLHNPFFVNWQLDGKRAEMVAVPWSATRTAALHLEPPYSYSAMRQTVDLPAGSQPVLRFTYAIGTSQPPTASGGQYLTSFSVLAEAEDGLVQRLLVDTRPLNATPVALDLSAFAGRRTTLTFKVSGSDYPMTAYVTKISLFPYSIVLPGVAR